MSIFAKFLGSRNKTSSSVSLSFVSVVWHRFTFSALVRASRFTSSDPLRFSLSILPVASAKIAEGPVVYMSSGSRLQLTCLVKQSPAPPDFIFWHHNGEVSPHVTLFLPGNRTHAHFSLQVLSYDSHRGIRVQKENSAQATSKLIIEKAHPADSGKSFHALCLSSFSIPVFSGNYSCVSDAAEAAHVAVHVSPSDGHPAAIQHGKRSAGDFVVRNQSFSPTFNFAILLMPFTVFCFTWHQIFFLTPFFSGLKPFLYSRCQIIRSD